MKSILKQRKAQVSLSDGPAIVLIVGLVFLLMATFAFVGAEYGDAINDDQLNLSAANITTELQKEIGSNTSIAGIVLTISLIGIVLSVLIGVFVATRQGGI